MKKHLLFIFTIFALSANAQDVNIPDANFLAKLKIIGIDKNNDKKIQLSEASIVTELNVSYSNIASLEGIQAFTALTNLDCQSNKLKLLDVTKNTALTYLHCSSNQLTALDVTKNIALANLYCYDNTLTALDVTKNTALTLLDCYDNYLTALDVTKNIALTHLHCYSNTLTALDVTKNTALTYLYCMSNQLTALDVTNNTALTILYCQINQISALDVTKNTALTYFDCRSNPKLTCIQALNTQVKKGTWFKDATANYNENCGTTSGIEEQILTTPKIIAHIYNIQGQEVSKYYSGLVIRKYTDGTSEKVIQE